METVSSGFDIAVFSSTVEAPWSQLGRAERERISLEVCRKILEGEPRGKLCFELDAFEYVLFVLTGRRMPVEDAFTIVNNTGVSAVVYMGGRDALWRKRRKIGKQVDGREALAQGLLFLDSVRHIVLMHDVSRGVAFSRREESGVPVVASRKIRSSLEQRVLLTKVVESLSYASLKIALDDYLVLIDHVCNDEMLRLPRDERGLDRATAEFLLYIRQLATLFPRLEEELDALPNQYRFLMSNFTKIVEVENSLRKHFSDLSDLAAMCPLDRFSPDEVPRDFDRLLKALNLAERPPTFPVDLAMDLVKFTEWFFYTYAGALNLQILSLVRALLKQPVLGLQYAVNTFNTSIRLAWACGMIDTLLVNPSNGLENLLKQAYSMKFGGNGLDFRFEFGQGLCLLADDHLRNSLSDLENGVGNRLREKRNRSPLSHGFVADLTEGELRDCLPELQNLAAVLTQTLQVTVDRVIKSLQASIQPFQNLPAFRDEEEDELRREIERLKVGSHLLKVIQPEAFFASVHELTDDALPQLDWSASLARDYVVREISISG